MNDNDSRSSTPEIPDVLPLNERWENPYARYPPLHFTQIMPRLEEEFEKRPLTTEEFVTFMDSMSRFPPTGRELILYASFLRGRGASQIIVDLINSAGGMGRIILPRELRYGARLLENFVNIEEESGADEPAILDNLHIPDIFSGLRFSNPQHAERIGLLIQNLLDHDAVLIPSRHLFNFSDEDQCVLL